MSVVTVESRGIRFSAVLALAKTAKNTVGFLPNSAYADRARQGTLLAKLDGDDLVGYVIYDLPRDDIKLIQLVVANNHRASGYARELLSAVEQRHGERRGVLLHCRNDFPAHQMWPKLGFSPVGERVGNSFDGAPLTRWWKGFGHRDLLSLLDEGDARPNVVLDSCTFFDLIAEERDAVAEQLRSDWLGDYVRLTVTDEVLVEISRGNDPTERDRQRGIAMRFARLTPPETAWAPILGLLRAAHVNAPTSDENDLRQIARALAAQASWLVTTDGAMRHRYSATALRLGNLQIVGPTAFLRQVDEMARGDWYRPVELAGTATTCREVDAAALPRLAEQFVSHRYGETIGDLRTLIESEARRRDKARLQIVEVDGEPRGLLCFEIADKSLQVRALRVTTGKGEATIGRHMLARLRDEAVAHARSAVVITDSAMSIAIRRGLIQEGFIETPSAHVAVALVGTGTYEHLRNLLSDLDVDLEHKEALLRTTTKADTATADAAALAEARFAPYRVLSAGIQTFVVPIKHAWATALFEVDLAAGQLFARDWNLGLRRELVYYRSPLNAGGLRAPARVLWYVSGTQPGGRSLRAVSMLDEVLVARSDHLFHRFERLGIYSRQDVQECSGPNGNAMALRFSSTELFSNPVTLDEYRAVISGDPTSRSVFLLSPQIIQERDFVELYRRGTGREL